MHEDHFKYSKDPIRKRIYDERIKPNIDEPPYNVSFTEIFQYRLHRSYGCFNHLKDFFLTFYLSKTN